MQIKPQLYAPVVTLSTLNNAKLHEQLKSGSIRTNNWNKYQSKKSREKQTQYLDYLTDASFQGVNRLLVLSVQFIRCSTMNKLQAKLK